MGAFMRRSVQDGERGASLIEYMLLVVLIAVVALIAITFAGGEVSEMWSEVDSGLEGADSGVVLVVTGPPGLCKMDPSQAAKLPDPPPLAGCNS